MWREFKAFVARGNVIDLAIARDHRRGLWACYFIAGQRHHQAAHRPRGERHRFHEPVQPGVMHARRLLELERAMAGSAPALSESFGPRAGREAPGEISQ